MNSTERAKTYVKVHTEDGHHIDGRVRLLLEAGNPVEQISLTSPEEFLRLQFHANDASRLLTPACKPRTLKDVIDRMIVSNWNFELLTSTLDGFDRSCHHPEWFEQCRWIEQTGFSFESFGSIFLMDLVHDEASQSPLANYSLYDGTHRSLVLASRVVQSSALYQPINAFVFRPRPVDL